MAKATLAFLVTLTGDHASAMVLSQILYWHQGKLRVQRKGTYWLAKSRADMCAETGISLEQYKRIMPLLVRQGWIVTERGLFNNRVTPHIQLTEKGRSLLTQLGGKATQSALGVYTSNQLASLDSNLITETTDHYITAESTANGCAKKTSRVDPNLGSGKDQIKIIPPICQEGTMNAKQILAAHKAQLAGKTSGSLPSYWKRRCYMATGKTQHELTGKERGQLWHLQKYLGGNTRTIIDYVTEHWWTFATTAQTSAGLLSFPTDPHIGFLLAHYQVAINLLTPQPVSPPVVVETPVQPIAPAAKTEPPHVMTSQELTEMLEWIKSS